MENRLQVGTSWVLSVLFACGATGTVFTVQPEDVTVTDGSDATFRCGTDLPCSFFYWGRYRGADADFSYVSKCLTSYESRYAVRREDDVYSLRVGSVGLEDSGTAYECWQYSQAGGGWLKSTNATLTVVPSQTASEPPVCSMNPPGPHRVGDTVALACSYPGTAGQAPAKKLSWTAGDERAKQGEGRIVRTLSETDNFREFTCKPRPGITNGSGISRENCTLTPLAIPTNVSISPPGPLAVTEGAVVVLRCRARAVPEATSYAWALSKDGEAVDPGRRVLISGGTLRILGSSAEDDGMEVACEASNAMNITGRSPRSRLSVRPTRATQATTAAASSDQPATRKGRESSKNPEEELTQWSQLALVVGIMLSVVVAFAAAGLGLVYARWRRRMNEVVKDAAPASLSPDGGGGGGGGGATFSLHNPGAHLEFGDGCVRASVGMSPDGSLAVGRLGAHENLYTENVYMEIMGQPIPCAPAPAHERAVDNEPPYERHIF